MKTHEDDLVYILHACLQADEDSRRGWAARNESYLAQRLHMLAPELCADVSRIASWLGRRRQPFCWCLLLLGGRVDIQLLAVAELFQHGRGLAQATILEQVAAELTQLQNQQRLNSYQQQQQKSQQQLLEFQPGYPSSSDSPMAVASTRELLPDGASAGDVPSAGNGQQTETLKYCTERLVELLGCVSQSSDCMDLVSHVMMRRNGAPLKALIRMLAAVPGMTTATATKTVPLSPVDGSGGGGASLRDLQSCLAGPAVKVLSYISACSEVRRMLLTMGAVPALLACLEAAIPKPSSSSRVCHPSQQQLAADAAQCLFHFSLSEAAAREMVHVHGPVGLQALVSLISGAAGSAALKPAIHTLAALSTHPTLRPGLVAAGATEALLCLMEQSGGVVLLLSESWVPEAGGGDAGARRGSGGDIAEPRMMAMALLTLVRCIRSYGNPGTAATGSGGAGGGGAARVQSRVQGGGGGGDELPASMLQVLLDVAAMPLRPHTQPPQQPPGSLQPLSGKVEEEQQMHNLPQDSPAAVGALAVVEATETLADMARDTPGALRLLSFAGHLALLQRLLAAMPAASLVPPSTLPPDALARCQVDASLRGLARMAMAAPSHPDLRLARTHEVLLHVVLSLGLADRPGWWALQGLCALATDAPCATDLVAAGVLPPVVVALRGLAAAAVQTRRPKISDRLRRYTVNMEVARGAPAPLPPPLPPLPPLPPPGRVSSVGGGNTTSAATASSSAAAAAHERALEVAHLLGLLLQNLAGHKALAKAVVAQGAVPAICEWLAVCVSGDDVEGAVLCCASLCLLGDGDPGALVDMVHTDGIDTMVELLHPRWATAALVPSTVAAAVAVACRWPASAQAVRMAAGIPALADTLRGPHGLACCRPVVCALVDLIANDPPALREIRTTNTVIALGTQLQLLPNNDPRTTRIRLLLRQLGEDPDTAMRLANSEADNTLAAAAPHHHHHHFHPGMRQPNSGLARLQLAAATAAVSGSGRGSGRRRFAQASESGPERPPPLTEAATAVAVGVGGFQRALRRMSSPGAIVPEEPPLQTTAACLRWRREGQGSAGRGGGGGSVGRGRGFGGTQSASTSTSRDDLDSVLAALRGESSYKSLRRASLKQLAKRMDASDFSDAEDEVEKYMAVLEVSSRDQISGPLPPDKLPTSSSRKFNPGTSVPTGAPVPPLVPLQPPNSTASSHLPVAQGPAAPAATAVSLAYAPVAAATMTSDAISHTVVGSVARTASAEREGGPGGAAWGRVVDVRGPTAGAGLSAGKPGPQPQLRNEYCFVSYEGRHEGAAALELGSGDDFTPQPAGHSHAYDTMSNDPSSRGTFLECVDNCSVVSPDGLSAASSSHEGAGGHRAGRRSSEHMSPSVDLWLETNGVHACDNHHSQLPIGNVPYDQTSQAVSTPEQQPEPSRDAYSANHHKYINGRNKLGGGADSSFPSEHQYQYQTYHQTQFQSQSPYQDNNRNKNQYQEEQHQRQQRPVGWRGHNAVVHTLLAVNPLRLFGAMRRGTAPSRQQQEKEHDLGYMATASVAAGGGARRSLQVDGDELVYWLMDPEA